MAKRSENGRAGAQVNVVNLHFPLENAYFFVLLVSALRASSALATIFFSVSLENGLL